MTPNSVKATEAIKSDVLIVRVAHHLGLETRLLELPAGARTVEASMGGYIRMEYPA